MFVSKVSSRLTKIGNRLSHQESNEYQFWQKSKIPSMHFQSSLPRLPIPKLEQTCKRYLRAQQPLLSDEAFKNTKKYVTQFKDNDGKILQQLLTAKNEKNKYSSYISQPWFDMYLEDRKPLPINYNPALIYIDDSRPEFNTQLLKASNLVISSLRFFKSLQAGILEPEVYHMNSQKSDTKLFRNICSKVPSSLSWYASYLLFNAYPLDMSQYYNLFNSTRIPQIDKDKILMNKNSKHIIVQHKGNFYAVTVLDGSGNILPANKILGSIKSILAIDEATAEFPIGILTSLNRNEWAKQRQKLLNLGNKHTLDTIDSALFNLCLDDVDDGSEPISRSKHFLHSDGKNRWFDKSFSLIVTKSSAAGINFEHSWGDGVAVLRYMQDIHKDFQQNPQVNADTNPSFGEENVRKIDFNLDDDFKNLIVRACEDYKKWCDSLGVNVVQVHGLGKNICKKFSLSPDAIMQLGFQVAYHKLCGKFVGSYESCSTAAFKHGRTETIRPCTMATKELSLALNLKKSLSNQDLMKLIVECSKVHGQLTKNALMGQGFDRHLFALKLFTNDKLDFYEDLAFKGLNHHIISTSTLATTVIGLGAFGPVVKDGYGIAYTIQENELGVMATSYVNHANGPDFITALEKSYLEILSILQKN